MEPNPSPVQPPDLQAELASFRADSAQRLARLRPTDTLKGLIISDYLRVFRRLGGEAMVERGLAALGEQRIVDVFNYPYSTVIHMGLAVVEDLMPAFGGVAPWLHEMGRISTMSYFRSALGRAFLSTFRPSPRSMLLGMPWAIGTCLNFGQRSVVFTGPREAVFRCRFEFSPASANAGAVQAAVESAGGQQVAIGVEPFDLYNYDLHLSWR